MIKLGLSLYVDRREAGVRERAAKHMPSNPSDKGADASLPTPSYAAIESFIEHAEPAQIEALFAGIKKGLSSLKGPKSAQAKKVLTALSRTEELLGYLIGVREKLRSERGSKSSE